jgi:hypothetical protein
MFFDTRRRRIALVLAGIALGVLALGTGRDAVIVAPGAHVLALRPQDIVTVDFRSAVATVAARRTPAGDFDVQASGQDGRAHRCTAPPDLAGIVPALSTITARRQLMRGELADRYPVQAGTLQLGDRIGAMPIAPFGVRATRDGRTIALVTADVAFESDVAPDVFTRLAAGCAALAAR